MPEFDRIYLSWRKGQGARRFIVGVLELSDARYIFKYDKSQVEEAKKEGFAPYTEFSDVHATYNGNTLETFAQRLTKTDRPDSQSFYSFWEIAPERKNDKFYLLGHTQALLPTDNFEFLADYNPLPGLQFVTELAGLSWLELPANTLKPRDSLTYQLEPQNRIDPFAVKVFSGDIYVGYIKKIHSRVFYKKGAENLQLHVKAVDQNGIIRRVFVKVAYRSAS